MDIERIRDFFYNDFYAYDSGARIVSAKEGEAVCSLELTSCHNNAGGGVQGGVIFTLADFAFAVAANCGGRLTVSLTSNITFINQPKGKTLTAHARERAGKKTVCFYDVSVTDELDTTIAQVGITGYRKDVTLNF